MQLERGLFQSIESKIKNLQANTDLTANQVIFLKHAVEVLGRSRRILVYTYVFAFFANKSNQLSIFEDNQRDLEVATEALSGFMEQDITDENVAEIKIKIQEKYAYCDRRQKVLLEHVHEGYKEEWWHL